MTSYNINSFVYVKLTDIGIQELKRQHDELITIYPSMGDFKIQVNNDGYVKLQMHELMLRLGHLCSLGFIVPFETEILFDSDDLKEH